MWNIQSRGKYGYQSSRRPLLITLTEKNIRTNTESHATQFDITLLEIMHSARNLQISHQSASP